MAETNFLEEQIANKRSTMLTVLCILSFVGSGFGIIGGAFNLTSMRAKNMQQMQEKMQQDKAKLQEKMAQEKNKKNSSKLAIKMMEASADMADPVKMKTAGILNLICSCITILGAILMWKRNRLGFYLYVVGSVAFIGVYAYVFGLDNFISFMTIIFNSFVSVVFIILYAMCLKEMNRKEVVVY